MNQLLCSLGMMIGAGKYGDVTWGDMLGNNLIPVSFGNFLGALVLAMIMYGCYHREMPEYVAKEKLKHSVEGTEVSVVVGDDSARAGK